MTAATSPLVDFFEFCRPTKFSHLAGNVPIKREIGRMLMSLGVPKGVLIHAPIGIGKTTIARLLACAHLCEERTDMEPCGQCESCRQYLHGGRGLCLDKVLTYSNCARLSIEEFREHQDMAASCGEWVFVYDEFHRATWRLQDTLLTWLEDGSDDVRIIICTTKLDYIEPALAQRCHLMEPSTPTEDEMTAHLQSMVSQLLPFMPGTTIESGVLRELSRCFQSPRAILNGLRTLLLNLDHVTIDGWNRLQYEGR